MKITNLPIPILLILLFSMKVNAQNPIIRDQFSADPTARVFNGKVYLYPSHDILGKEGQGRPNWFCMEDYHVFSSENLTEWTDHGMIVSQTTVPWAMPESYSMWAPDCVERNGKYYFYFPTAPDSIYGKRFAIGVAVSDQPEGPFIPQPTPIKNVHGIDPNVFIDKDGQAYLYWSGGNIYGAKLKENMLELASESVILNELPTKGLKEGPFLFERNNVYYMTFPHVENNIERLEYAISDNPLGPFKMTGVVMDESPVGCWTNHHSFVNYKNQWYLFYHSNDYSPKFDKNRSVRIDSMFFNTDGTIQKVIPTLRGVGLTAASSKIEIDRYSAISEKGISILFNDTLNTFAGWKTVFNAKDAWVKYNSVDFGIQEIKSIQIKSKSEKGSTIQICLDKADGPVIAEVKIPKGTDWHTIKAKISKYPSGIHNLVVVLKDKHPVEIDWVSFK